MSALLSFAGSSLTLVAGEVQGHTVLIVGEGNEQLGNPTDGER
jgi:hypothetical protein